jgi:hypothetical protein
VSENQLSALHRLLATQDDIHDLTAPFRLTFPDGPAIAGTNGYAAIAITTDPESLVGIGDPPRRIANVAQILTWSNAEFRSVSKARLAEWAGEEPRLVECAKCEGEGTVEEECHTCSGRHDCICPHCDDGKIWSTERLGAVLGVDINREFLALLLASAPDVETVQITPLKYGSGPALALTAPGWRAVMMAMKVAESGPAFDLEGEEVSA